MGLKFEGSSESTLDELKVGVGYYRGPNIVVEENPLVCFVIHETRCQSDENVLNISSSFGESAYSKTTTNNKVIAMDVVSKIPILSYKRCVARILVSRSHLGMGDAIPAALLL